MVTSLLQDLARADNTTSNSTTGGTDYDDFGLFEAKLLLKVFIGKIF